MTRITNFGRKRTYLQSTATSSLPDEAESTEVALEKAGETAEPGSERPKKKRKKTSGSNEQNVSELSDGVSSKASNEKKKKFKGKDGKGAFSFTRKHHIGLKMALLYSQSTLS